MAAGSHSQFVLLLIVLFFGSCLMYQNSVEASHKLYHLLLQSEQPSIVSNQYRTAYHFQPPKNWINGPMYYSGVYHLFYQYNPKGAVWGNIVWAHSVSRDLLNWTPLPPAIYPSKPFDINGCWSGSATILPGNKPAILYTGIDPENRQVQNIAFPKNLSDPFLREWVKPDYNPVMAPVGGINASSFRDPTTGWRGRDGVWRLLVGSKIDRTGMAILYRSKDFVHWAKAARPLHSREGTGMWECPDFFPVALSGRKGLDTSAGSVKKVKHVLKVSLDETRYEYYTVGSYVDEAVDAYVPDGTSPDDRTGLRLDYGNFYASKTFYDPAGKRRILWGWSNESDSVADDVAKGWAGIQAIPRVLWLDTTGRQLVQWPIKEIESLRREEFHVRDVKLKTGKLHELKGADVQVEFDLPSLKKAEPFDPTWLADPQKLCNQRNASFPGGVGPFGLYVLASANLEEYTALFFRVYKAPNKYMVLMCSDQSRSSLRPEVYKPAFGGFVDVDISKRKKLSLRALIDHSVVESFGGGGRVCITARVYPTLLVAQKAHLYAFNKGLATVGIEKLQAWNMAKAKIN
ncbi:hypothetical protein Taro_050234 [Colocasia esculenta]|uniref:Beta-fructofuranosidase n=1 Tax=Colocasia esculenta TaxID=4460 RepID=A0A843XDA9_COLES|nr:hypothetical protein [Colocasia esculenta]